MSEMIDAAWEDDPADPIPPLRVLKPSTINYQPSTHELQGIHPLGEFLRHVGPPPPMLVEDLIPDHSLLLLAGKPKHLKSFLAADIVDAVCDGRDVCGRFRVNKPGPVVYFALEDGPYETARRWRLRGYDDNDSRNAYLCTEEDAINLADEDEVKRMATTIIPYNPVLVVVDTAVEAFDIGSWYNRVEIRKKIKPLRQFCRQICSVVLVFHNRKAAGQSGDEIAASNALAGAVDGWISIYHKEQLENGNMRLLARREGRGGMRGEFAVEMDTQTLRFQVVDIDEQTLQQDLDRSRFIATMDRCRIIARALSQAGGKASNNQLTEHCELTYKTIQVLTREMSQRGMLLDTGQRGGPRNNIVLWQLSPLMQSWVDSICPTETPDYNAAAAMFPARTTEPDPSDMTDGADYSDPDPSDHSDPSDYEDPPLDR